MPPVSAGAKPRSRRGGGRPTIADVAAKAGVGANARIEAKAPKNERTNAERAKALAR